MQATSANGFFGAGFSDTTTTAYGFTTFPTPMRTAPSALEQSGTAGDYLVNRSGSNITSTSVPVFDGAEAFAVRTRFTTGASQTAGQGVALRSANSTAYLAWSAEL